MITNDWFVVCGDWTVKAIIYIGKMENGEGGYCKIMLLLFCFTLLMSFQSYTYFDFTYFFVTLASFLFAKEIY